MYRCLKPFLFALPPEAAHHLCLKTLSVYAALCGHTAFENPKTVMGLTFPNPVGLAAGLDKNGAHVDAWFKLGFGFVEVGTLTPRPQSGNPKPRLFRLKQDHALINRMGFNNLGVDHFIKHHQRKNRQGILGINIGKNKDTPLEKAHEDYAYCFDKVCGVADYVTVNISSPNTPNLRDLAARDSLTTLLSVLKKQQSRHQSKTNRYVPLVVKLSPDMTEQALEATAQALLEYEVDGIIATNTTLSRASLKDKQKEQAGGMSGAPLAKQATATLKRLDLLLDDKIPLMGSGGIMSAREAQKRFEAGASLIQLYSGLIYRGPKLIQEVACL